jgi:hypothetical protein
MCQCQIPANRVAAYVGHRLSEAAASDLPISAQWRRRERWHAMNLGHKKDHGLGSNTILHNAVIIAQFLNRHGRSAITRELSLTAWLDKAQWPSIAFRGIVQNVANRIVRRSRDATFWPVKHPELRVNFFGPRVKMGFLPKAK